VGEGAFACGDNLRWIDARNVGEDWKEELVYGNYILKTPGDMGVPLFTLLYMPIWWTANDKNIVVTDATTQERSCSKFSFSSEMDYNVPWGFTAEQVINTRTLPMDDGAYTICLPYDLGIPDNAKVYVLMETDVPEGDKVVFTQVVGTLDKGMPYLVKADGDVSLNSEIPSQILSTEEAQTSSMTVAGITINGTFSNITHADAANMGAYVLQAENRWVSVSKRSEAVYVPPYRAYITMEGFMANGFSISFSDSIDDIRLLPDGTAVIDGGTWYTLQGVQLPSRPHTPGVYVHQGRKYVVK
jgi:hypothetical protein